MVAGKSQGMTGLGNLFIMADKGTESAQNWERLFPKPVMLHPVWVNSQKDKVCIEITINER